MNPLGHPDSGLQVGGTRLALQNQIKNGKVVPEVIYPSKIASAKFVHPFKWEAM